MQIQVNTVDGELPAAFREFAEARVSETLRHLSRRLTRVEVHMKDVNGQKQGIDKRCVIEARPRGMNPVVVEHQAAEAREALLQAAQKLQRALKTQFDRRSAR